LQNAFDNYPGNGFQHQGFLIALFVPRNRAAPRTVSTSIFGLRMKVVKEYKKEDR